MLLQSMLCSWAKSVRFSSGFKKKWKETWLSNNKNNSWEFKICANCFTKLCWGCSHWASQCQYFRCIKVSNHIEISSSTTIQRAASREQYLSEVPVTPLGRPKKVEKVKKELFLSAECSGSQEDLGLSNSKAKVLLRDIRFGVSFTFYHWKEFFCKNSAKQSSTRQLFWIAKISLSSWRQGHQNCKKRWASDNSVFPTTSVNWDNSSKATEGQTISLDKTKYWWWWWLS